MSPRLPFLVLAAGAITAAALVTATPGRPEIDVAGGRGMSPTGGLRSGLAASVASSPANLTSTWYCSAGTAAPDGLADHTVVVFNPTDRAIEGVATVYAGGVIPPRTELVTSLGNAGPGDEATDTTPTAMPAAPPPAAPPNPGLVPVQVPFDLTPQGRVSIRLADWLPAPLAAALVEVDGGGVSVEHEVRGQHGIDAGPCVTATSDVWHFAWGVTERDARDILVFFNPFPDDATVDTVFSTDDGMREPLRFRGLPVPARSVVGIDVGQEVTRNQNVSVTVTVRTGRIVAERLQLLDGSREDEGLSVATGAPEPATDWVFPHGLLGEGRTERVVLYNPGDTRAVVDILAVLQDPKGGKDAVAPRPFQVTVAARGYEVVDIGDDGRVPTDRRHTTIVTSIDGVPVVAERVATERWEESTSSRRGSAPHVRRDLTAGLGTPFAATAWAFPGNGGGDLPPDLVLFNPNRDLTSRVRLSVLVRGIEVLPTDARTVVLRPGEVHAVELREHLDVPADGDTPVGELSIAVEANQPIVAGRVALSDRGLAVGAGVGIPARDGLSAVAWPGS